MPVLQATSGPELYRPGVTETNCGRVNTQVRPRWRTTSWRVLKYKTKNDKLWEKCTIVVGVDEIKSC